MGEGQQVERETVVEKIKVPTTTVIEGEPNQPNEVPPQEPNEGGDQDSNEEGK